MSADVVMQWNNSTLDAIRATNTPPPVAARSLAMVHAAIFDAVNSITQTYSAYEFDFVAPPTASKEAAVTAAAQRVLTNLFPAQATLFAGLTSTILATVPDGRNEDAGVHVGQLAADAVLALRDADGADATVNYQPGTDLGQWRTTEPGNAAALLPQWADVAPFVLTTADQFSSELGGTQIPALDSAEYAAAFDEVKSLGSATSTTRTAEQTEIAQFWANGAGTATPPGHLNVMAQVIAQPRKLTIEQQAKLFAQLNLALADTAIAVWELKYDTNYWRPMTAIRSGDIDGNDATQADPTWVPLITTPPFPTYVSGHSAFSAAAAAVMENFFGTDAISFTLPSESSSASDRSFTSLSQAAEESAVSRLYGGVHWAFDNRDGLELGTAIGSHVSAQTLSVATSPVPIGVYDGVLVITGTDQGEAIRVLPKGTQLEVMINGKSKGRFSAAAIQSISIDAKGGNDKVEITGRILIPVSIEGGAGNDRLVGGLGNDFISGGLGQDAIYGGRGDDSLLGGLGNDYLRGEIGNDSLFGDEGNDWLFGDAGTDTLEGDLGDDSLWGGIGNDTLTGDEGNDVLYGGSGNDTLTGDDGNDRLYGEAGRDLLFGGLGNDFLVGGGQVETLDGGPGNNRIRR